MITAYTPTFGSSVLHLAANGNMMVTLCVGASNFFWLPVMGSLSDRIGRRPILGSVGDRSGAADGLSGVVVAGERATFIQPADGSGTVVLLSVRQLQRSDGGLSHGDHARRRPHRGILSGS